MRTHICAVVVAMLMSTVSAAEPKDSSSQAPINTRVLVGVVKSVQFECFDLGKANSVSCSGKVQISSKNSKTIFVQIHWNPNEEKMQWLYSPKELTFYVEQLDDTTDYGLLRMPVAEYPSINPTA